MCALPRLKYCRRKGRVCVPMEGHDWCGGCYSERMAALEQLEWAFEQGTYQLAELAEAAGVSEEDAASLVRESPLLRRAVQLRPACLWCTRPAVNGMDLCAEHAIRLNRQLGDAIDEEARKLRELLGETDAPPPARRPRAPADRTFMYSRMRARDALEKARERAATNRITIAKRGMR